MAIEPWVHGPLEVAASWEEYGDLELEKLLLACHVPRGGVEVRLWGGEVRYVLAEWFSSVQDSALYMMLFDERWARTGELQESIHTFDDICTYLRAGTLPPEHPRARQRRLARAASFYGLTALEEALEEADDRQQAASMRALREKQAAAAALRRIRRREKQLQKQSHDIEARAHSFMEDVASWSVRGGTKAQDLRNVLSCVQRLCREDGVGPRSGYNKQQVYSAPNMAKRYRHG